METLGRQGSKYFICTPILAPIWVSEGHTTCNNTKKHSSPLNNEILHKSTGKENSQKNVVDYGPTQFH